MEQQTGSQLGKECLLYSSLYIVILLVQLLCRVHCMKWQAGWNQDCWEKYQQPQIYRWYHSNGRKWRGTKELLDGGDKGKWKTGLKLNIQTTRTMASSSITSWLRNGEKVEKVADFIFLDGNCSNWIKRLLFLGGKAMTNLDSILKKKRYHFANKGPCSQSYGFSSSHVQIWELEHKKGWALKNWWFWTVELEKTLESPLDSKEINPDNPKGNQHWIFIGRTNREAESESESRSVLSDSLRPYGCTVQGILQARILEWVAFPICGVSAQPRDQAQVSPIAGRFFSEAEAPVFWTPDAKNRLIEKDSDAGKALKAGREGSSRLRDGWMASLTQWKWVWASSGRWWRTGKPGVLQSMVLQRVKHKSASEQAQPQGQTYHWGSHSLKRPGPAKTSFQ